MADAKKGIKEGEVIGAPVVASTTEETPAEADKTSLPNALDAKPDQPPVRAAKPDTPIAQTLAAGAGEHMPPDSDEFSPDGRPYDLGHGAEDEKARRARWGDTDASDK